MKCIREDWATVSKFENVNKMNKLKFVNVVRSPKLKVKRLGNVRTGPQCNDVLTGNIRKLAAAFDHHVGGGKTNEVFVQDSALQEKILLLKTSRGMQRL